MRATTSAPRAIAIGTICLKMQSSSPISVRGADRLRSRASSLCKSPGGDSVGATAAPALVSELRADGPGCGFGSRSSAREPRQPQDAGRSREPMRRRGASRHPASAARSSRDFFDHMPGRLAACSQSRRCCWAPDSVRPKLPRARPAVGLFVGLTGERGRREFLAKPTRAHPGVAPRRAGVDRRQPPSRKTSGTAATAVPVRIVGFYPFGRRHSAGPVQQRDARLRPNRAA